VTIYVSTGRAKMPKVTGMDEAEARDTLNTFGLPNQNITVVTEPSPNTPAGTVLESNPPEGTIVDQNTRVTLKVAAEQSKVPSTRGMTYEAAEALLVEAGFSPTKREEASEQVPKGQVIRTDPIDGAQPPANGIIIVYVSTGPPTPEPTDPPAQGRP
jgi:serine/threonine-protein kinase